MRLLYVDNCTRRAAYSVSADWTTRGANIKICATRDIARGETLIFPRSAVEIRRLFDMVIRNVKRYASRPFLAAVDYPTCVPSDMSNAILQPFNAHHDMGRSTKNGRSGKRSGSGRCSREQQVQFAWSAT